MKIVIVGAGKIGYSLAEELTNENHDITVVDIDKDKVKLLSDTLDVMTLCGNLSLIHIFAELKYTVLIHYYLLLLTLPKNLRADKVIVKK